MGSAWGLCGVCGQWCRGHWCGACWRLWGPAGEARCPGCGLRLAPGPQRCADCEREPRPWRWAVAAVDYTEPWPGPLQALKYGRQPGLARGLAALLQAALQPHQAAWPEVLVPVPVSSARLRQRGFNQSALLARHLARGLQRPSLPAALLRPVHQSAQAQAGRGERLQRLHGVMTVATAALPGLRGRRVALVDDVCTTGATAAEATRALLSAGVAEVALWVVARTPAPVEGAS